MSVLSPSRPAPTVRPGALKARRKRTRVRSGYNLMAGLAIVLIGFPVYWMVATALKPGNKALQPTPQWFPWPLTTANFTAAVHKDFFLSSLRNSVLVVVCVVVLALLVASLAALAVSRFQFRGRAVFIVMIVGIQMVPLAGLVIPLFRVLATAHLTNRIPGLVLAYLTFVLPFTVWTLRGFITNIPVELEEAALVDGCSRTSAFFRITLPLIAPGLVATGIFAFIQAWNDFLLAVTIMQNNKDYTATVWLSFFTNRQGTSYPELMAGSTIIAAPVVVFFMAVQHRVAAGLTAGAVKG
ncbi:MAG: N,N-diacetylchitobiose transport system permease protein [Frankiales bacterium]|nr:N,N-diacetylchitobiose transport system permease protein [Frankiales bacterium]